MSDAPAPPAAEAPAGGLKAKLPLIAAIVVGLAVGAGTGAAVVGPIVVSKLGMTQAPAKAGHEPAAAGEHEPADTAAAGEHGDKVPAPPVLLLENLVLNPAGSGGSRYLLMSIAIECANAAGVAAMTARDAELRDLILATLGRKTVEELADVTGRETIKVEIVTALNVRFGQHSIKQLYFPQFVIQ